MRGDRLIALFLLGCLGFSPVLLQVFAGQLFAYLFAFWALLIALLAWIGRPR